MTNEMENEEMAMYKAYIRKLIRDLKDIKDALKTKDYDKAKKLVDILIEDSQKDLEN